MIDPTELQLEYYRATAEGYDDMHARMEHLEALSHTVAFLRLLGVRSVLDTGCGTGFAMRHLAAALPELRIHGNDPSTDLLGVATGRYEVDPSLLDCAHSESLPYEDGAFDAVVETGVLHHVPAPDRVVDEMLRVARMAVFISDVNCYGMGSWPGRPVKLALARTRLLPYVNRLRRGGHSWYSTPGDGVAWTYSVFDSYATLRRACPSVVVIPTQKESFGDKFPLMCASHCLVAAFKRPLAEAMP